MHVEIINTSHHPLPAYATVGASGLDLRAYIPSSPITLTAYGGRAVVDTGLKIALPAGFEAQVRPRSGWAFKHGVTVLNAPGTIDSDYRGEIKVLLVNFGSEPVLIQDGERIAQLVISSYQKISWLPVDCLSDTSRGEGGYGSTGKV